MFELIAASLQSTLLIDKPALLVIGFQPNQPQLTLLWFHFTSSLFNKSIIFVWIKLRKKVEWKRLIDGMRAGKEIYNPLRRNLKLMELILMKAAALSISLQSIISFHNKRKLNFSFFVSFNNWFYEIDWMELKKYYNSTVIRAGIYLLSAIMKNFVLNYERQLVDDCDNNERREPTKRNKSYLLFGFVERKSDMAESTTQFHFNNSKNQQLFLHHEERLIDLLIVVEWVCWWSRQPFRSSIINHIQLHSN